MQILVLISLYFLKCTKFDQLILRKTIKTVATRCHILTLKCTKIDFGWGSAPDPAGGLQSSRRPLAGFKGPTSLPTCLLLTHVALCHRVRAGAPAGFQARVGKIRRKAPKNFFRLPTLVFSLPTLTYVTVAHRAHRTEADLREKASLPLIKRAPSPPLRLA